MNERERLVTFRRGRATYAVDVRHVRKVMRAAAVRPLAAAPAFVAGGLTVDGRLEVLVDLASFFDDADVAGSRDRAVLVSREGRDFALLADAVGELTDVDASGLQPLPPFLGGARRYALRGVVPVGREQVLVVDLTSLLASPELDAVAAARPPDR